MEYCEWRNCGCLLTVKCLCSVIALIQIAEKPNAKAVRSSAAFFSRLQDEVKNHIKMNVAGSGLGRQKAVTSAKRLKL
jgi:hypothetical protein